MNLLTSGPGFSTVDADTARTSSACSEIKGKVSRLMDATNNTEVASPHLVPFCVDSVSRVPSSLCWVGMRRFSSASHDRKST